MLSVPNYSNAQIIKDIIRKAGNRLENKAEDMIAEAIAEALARQLQKKIDNYFDELARESYRQDSIRRVENGDTLLYKNYQEMLEGMMSGMNNVAAVKDAYNFALALDVEIGSGKEIDEARFFYDDDEAIFAVEQVDDKDGVNIMLFDLENNVIVLFNEDKKGKKTAQALPWLLNMNSMMTGSDQELLQPLSITKTGNTKDVAGYSCEEYKGEDEENLYTIYTNQELGEYWRTSMGSFMQRFTNYQYNDEVQKMDGMMMESLVVKKQAEKKKKKFQIKKKKDEIPPDSDSWKVIKVNKETFTVTKADYSFIGVDN